MKKIIFAIFLLIPVFFLFIGCNNNSSDFNKNSNKWKKYRDDKNGTYFYKKEKSATKKGKHLVRVWHKKSFSDHGRKEYIQKRTEEGLTTDGYDKLSHRLVLYEINCGNQRGSILSVIFYDTDGKILDSRELGDINWEYINPYTASDIVQAGICK